MERTFFCEATHGIDIYAKVVKKDEYFKNPSKILKKFTNDAYYESQLLPVLKDDGSTQGIFPVGLGMKTYVPIGSKNLYTDLDIVNRGTYFDRVLRKKNLNDDEIILLYTKYHKNFRFTLDADIPDDVHFDEIKFLTSGYILDNFDLFVVNTEFMVTTKNDEIVYNTVLFYVPEIENQKDNEGVVSVIYKDENQQLQIEQTGENHVINRWGTLFREFSDFIWQITHPKSI